MPGPSQIATESPVRACGTATGWRQGCRCDACRDALHKASAIWWATARLRAGHHDVATRVSRLPTARHLDLLRAAGITDVQIARRSGVSVSTLWRARQRGVKVSRIVEAAVLAVQP